MPDMHNGFIDLKSANMGHRCILVWMAWMVVSIDRAKLTAADDNNILLYNSIGQCKANEYFDVNYFVCKPCDAKLFLMRAINGECAARPTPREGFCYGVRALSCPLSLSLSLYSFYARSLIIHLRMDSNAYMSLSFRSTSL